MHTTGVSTILRLLTGIILVGGVFSAGWMARSPGVIPMLALVFTASYVIGRWPAWAHATNTGSLARAALQLPLTYILQAALVAVLYLIGRGASALAGRSVGTSAMTQFDAIAGLILGLFAAISGLTIALIERASQRRTPDEIAVAPSAVEAGDFTLLPTPVTPENFFNGIHGSHGSYDSVALKFNGTPNEQSAGGESKIALAQTRLEVQLPEGLKALYRLQNGGSVKSVCVPKGGGPEPSRFADVVIPFGGYETLVPMEHLETLHEHITQYADPDDPDEADMFPQGCEQMLVLARKYHRTLFLDYRQPGEPRVGLVDFEHSDWNDRCVWWNDFDTFFRALRYYRLR